jgi:hypothetical protein
MTLELGIVATNSTSSKMINDPGAATYSCTMPPDDEEAMAKTTARPRRVGWLAKHRRTQSTATMGTVAQRHAMPRREHKIITTATPRCTPQDDITCKPS